MDLLCSRLVCPDVGPKASADLSVVRQGEDLNTFTPLSVTIAPLDVWGLLGTLIQLPTLGRYCLQCVSALVTNQVSQWCNAYLDCSAWGQPPWSHDQWATLRVIIEMAEIG